MTPPHKPLRLVVLRLPQSHWYLESFDPAIGGQAPITHVGTPVPEGDAEYVKERAEEEGILLEEGEGNPEGQWAELEIEG